jgi:pimeloyl-ACP methyl ester carboxylesterase
MYIKIPVMILTIAIAFLFLFSSCTSSTDSFKGLEDAEWIVLGKYPNSAEQDGSCQGFDNDYLDDFGGEAALSSPDSEALPGNTGIKAPHNDGFLDIGSLFNNAGWSIAYVYSEFSSPGGEWFLHAGSDDGIKLWLNGELIINDHVHRELAPHDAVRRVKLREGKNRILAKICQATGEWAVSLKLYDEKQQNDYVSSVGPTSLSVKFDSSFTNPGKAISFMAYHSPQTGVSVPVYFRLIDQQKNIITEATGKTYERVEFTLPQDAAGIYTVTASFSPSFDETMESANAKCLIGDPDAVFASIAHEAREFASAYSLPTGSAYTSAPGLRGIPDIAETLTFLADRLEGKIHPSLNSDKFRIDAMGFILDILDAANSGEDGYRTLTGYRQWAYRSQIDDSLQPYSLYIPQSYDPKKQYGLVVFLHGYSGNDFDGALHLAELAPDDLFIASAYGRGDMYYESLAEQDVLDVMDRVMSAYPIDPDKVYLTGISMGGLGTWKIGQLYPERFAAIAPFCGWTGDELLDNLGNLGTFIVHGNQDTTVPVYMDRNAAAKLEKAGSPVIYTEIPGGSHKAWEEWSRTTDPHQLFEFFRSYVRNPSPEHIKALIPTVRYGKKYWISVTELDTSGSFSNDLLNPGTIEVQRMGNSDITITTDRIRAFDIDLELAGIDLSKAANITIDGQIQQIDPSPGNISFQLCSDGVWRIDEKTRTGLAQHYGDGVIGLFSKPLIIVYGTMDAQRKEVLEAGARQLADWSLTESVPVGVKTGIFRVKADTELTDSDIDENNLILIGNSSENAVTARIAEVFEPYYSGGKISLNGTTYERNGLCVTRPNPLAPDRIVACFDMPRDFLGSQSEVVQWFSSLSLMMRNSHRIGEMASYPIFSPDVMVLTRSPGINAWSGWFDRNWENLEGASG